MKRLLLYPVGLACLALAALGAVLPVLPGWPFFFIGLSILAPKKAMGIKRFFLRRWLKPQAFQWSEWTPLKVYAGFTTKYFPVYLKKTDDFLDTQRQESFCALIDKRRPRASSAPDAQLQFALAGQVHGDNVVALDNGSILKDRRFCRIPDTDGLLTNIPRLALLVMTADCLPIFFTVLKFDKKGKGAADWVGLVHAGWRGTRLEIAKKALQLLCKGSGCAPADVLVAFGPCIGREHYAVGEEFAGYFPQDARLRRPSLFVKKSRWHFDLAGENAHQLRAAGVLAKNLIDPGFCTVADGRLFYSFRRQKEDARRMISYIAKI